MKWVVGAICWGLSVAAQAVTIDRLTWSSSTDILRVYVTYRSGCLEHKFDLQLEGCEQTLPATATAMLIDTGSEDRCSVSQNKKLLQFAMTNLTCRPAFLTVRGSDDSKQTVFIK